MERIILTTGGTGGHIFPALAVAEEIGRRWPEARVLFIGSHYGPEGEWARKAGLDFVGLPVRGFLGRGLRSVGAGLRMTAALAKALWLVRRFRPQVVAGFGGYAAFAPMAAARCWGIPVAVHEQNAVAGVSNKVLARLADAVFLSMQGTQGFEGRSCLLTGNPVRQAVAAVGGQEHTFDGKRLLIVGGSLGAAALNAVIVRALPRLAEAGVQLRHQTGTADVDAVRAAYAAAGMDPQWVQPFIADMAETYAWADLVLCRAGATTVAELAAAGRPAVLVPFPHATHDHQTHNARLFAESGAAMMVAQKDLAEFDLATLLLRLLGEPHTLHSKGQAALAQARPQAAATLVDALQGMIERRQSEHAS